MSKQITRERLDPFKDKGRSLNMEPEEVAQVLNEYFALIFIKHKNMDNGEIGEGYVDILGHVDMKKMGC